MLQVLSFFTKQENANCNYSQSYNLSSKVMFSLSNGSWTMHAIIIWGSDAWAAPPEFWHNGAAYILSMGNFEISLGDTDVHSRLTTTTLDIKRISGHGPWIL